MKRDFIDRLAPFSGLIFFSLIFLSIFILRCEVKRLSTPDPEILPHEQ